MKIPITLVMHVEYEVSDNDDMESLKWYLEEEHCIDNVINFVHKKVQASDVNNECETCSYAKMFVGTAPMDEIGRLVKLMPFK